MVSIRERSIEWIWSTSHHTPLLKIISGSLSRILDYNASLGFIPHPQVGDGTIGDHDVSSQLLFRRFFHMSDRSSQLVALPPSHHDQKSCEDCQQNVSDMDFRHKFGFPPFVLIPAGFLFGMLIGLAIIFFALSD